MEPLPRKSESSRYEWAIPALMVVWLVWRFGCLWWNPIRFDGGLGAFFEGSALVSSNLLAVWLVFRDWKRPDAGTIWWVQILISLGLLVALQAAQDLGIVANDGSSLQLHSIKLIIYRHLAGESIAITVIAALAIRILTGWHISRREPQAMAKSVPLRLPLLNFFLLTGFVAVLAGLIRTSWFQEYVRNDTYEIHRNIFLYSLAVALAVAPASAILRVKCGWGAVAGMVAGWTLLPIAIRLASYACGWLIHDEDLLYQLATVVAGSGLVAAVSAFLLRRLGYRWRSWEPARPS